MKGSFAASAYVAAIRSYTATATRQGINALAALIQAATGNP